MSTDGMSEIEVTINKIVDFINKYAHDNYISPVIMEDILADELNLSVKQIIEFVESSKMVVTDEQVKKHLDKVFELKEPDLKKRIESRINRKSIIDLSEKELECLSKDELNDEFLALKYSFDSYTLTYLNEYITILKKKILGFLDLIKNVRLNKLKQYENDDVKNIKLTLLHYGIKMNEDGDLHYQDFINLLKPLIYNVLRLKDVLEKANNLDTYFLFYMSKECLSERGFSVFPTLELQIQDYQNDNMYGNIPLSDEQRNQLQKNYMRSDSN